MNDLKWSVVLCFVLTSSTVCIHVRSYCREQNVNLYSTFITCTFVLVSLADCPTVPI